MLMAARYLIANGVLMAELVFSQEAPMTIPQRSQPVSPVPRRLLDRLRADLAESLRHHESRLETDVDPGDIAFLIQRRSERARTEILSAFVRMEDGTYGLCSRCGDPVPWDRLEALPHAKHCTACAELEGER